MILVPLKSQPDLVTLVLNWASPGPSEYAPSGPHVDLVTLVPTWASSGHAFSALPAGWLHLDMVSVVATWTSLIPGDKGPTWASLGPGESLSLIHI